METTVNFNWKCRHTWLRSAKNTAWCVLGCSIGDFGTILFFQISKFKALKTALGMSFISMISMEVSMNFTDYILTGGAMLTWWVVPIMLIVGFLTPWPYNYWRLKKHNISCH